MLLEIIRRTPPWVWVLLIALIAIGASQARTRSLGTLRLALLPLAMTGYALFGMVQAFGLATLGAWVLGLLIALGTGIALGPQAGVQYHADSGRFRVPGSWIPLAIILAIFLSRYFVAVSLAMHPDLRQASAFAAASSLAYGLLGGIFPARALRVWLRRSPGQEASAEELGKLESR
jgi:hypothetical protein